MRNRRFAIPVLVMLALCLGMVGSSLPAKADDCPQQITYSYLGLYNSDGSVWCWVLIGPPPPWVVVGQRVVHCNGTITTWGTVCNAPPNSPIVEYDDCICRPGGGPVAAATSTNPATAPAADANAPFLATPSGGPTQTPNDLTPVPSFMTGCTDNAQCPTGQLCCNVCGYLPAKGTSLNCMACVTPINGHCPRVV